MTEQHPGAHLAALPQGGLPDQWLDAIHARHAAAEGGAWHLDPEPHTDPDTVRTNIAGWNRRIGILKFGAPYAAENQRFVLHSHQDVGALLAEVARLRTAEARLAELLRAGQLWRGDRLVSERRLGQPEIRDALGWPAPTAADAIARPVVLCELPHPVAADTWCDLPIEHNGWHQDGFGTRWPNSTLPRGDRPNSAT